MEHCAYRKKMTYIHLRFQFTCWLADDVIQNGRWDLEKSRPTTSVKITFIWYVKAQKVENVIFHHLSIMKIMKMMMKIILAKWIMTSSRHRDNGTEIMNMMLKYCKYDHENHDNVFCLYNYYWWWWWWYTRTVISLMNTMNGIDKSSEW